MHDALTSSAPRDDRAEKARLRALHSYEILDTGYDPQFAALVALASRMCQAPIAAISLVDEKRQWFKASLGLPEGVSETPRDIAFCSHTIQSDELMEVADTHEDVRFRDNPLVTGVPNIRHYAGVPLVDADRQRLGTLCVISAIPRRLSDDQRTALRYLGDLAMAILETRRRELLARRLHAESEEELEKARRILTKAASPTLGPEDGVHHAIRPATRFSGDLIGARRAADGSLYLMLADVMGHGLTSALFLLPLMQDFEYLAGRGVPVGELVAEVNHRLRLIMPQGHFAATCVARMDRAARTLEVWNGGLPDAWWLGTDGSVEYRFPSRHVALGLLSDAEFDGTTELLGIDGAGSLIVYSDGVTEAENDLGEAFGELRLFEAVAGPGNSCTRLTRVLAALDGFTRRDTYGDDVSLILADG